MEVCIILHQTSPSVLAAAFVSVPDTGTGKAANNLMAHLRANGIGSTRLLLDKSCALPLVSFC